MKAPEWKTEERRIVYDDVDTGRTEIVHILTLGNPKGVNITVEIHTPRNDYGNYRIYSNGQYHDGDENLDDAKQMAIDLIKNQVDDCWTIVKQYRELQ